MKRPIHYLVHAMLSVAVAAACARPAAEAFADEPLWDDAPTRIQAVLALDVSGDATQQLSMELPAYLERRANAAVGPAWRLTVQVAPAALRRQTIRQLTSPAEKPPDSFPADGDKLLLLAVRQTPDGYDLAAREFDRLVERWGMPILRSCRQRQALAEQLFALVWQVVAPVARFELEAADPQRATLQPRGGLLPLAAGRLAWAQPGDVFLPVLRRTTRSGELVANGAESVPWTYFEVRDVDGGRITARIHSASRRPFAARRRGRVEEVAIALRADPGSTVLRLRSRSKDDKPLVGYEVFAKNTDHEEMAPLGATDPAGRLDVPPGASRVQLLYVRNGGELLARLPVVPGADVELVAPLPDDDARLEAESRLSAMREDLVDVVVRRNILIARTRQKIEQKQWQAARELLRELDQLPGRPQFTLELSKEARLLHSDDPLIQRRIDRLIQSTQAALGQFLDNRPISDVHNELRAAQRAAADAPADVQNSPDNQAPSAAPTANSAADQNTSARQPPRGRPSATGVLGG